MSTEQTDEIQREVFQERKKYTPMWDCLSSVKEPTLLDDNKTQFSLHTAENHDCPGWCAPMPTLETREQVVAFKEITYELY